MRAPACHAALAAPPIAQSPAPAAAQAVASKLAVATGREGALLGTQVVASDVRAWSLGGRRPLAAAWALRWNAGHVKQGTLYARDDLALGSDRRF